MCINSKRNWQLKRRRIRVSRISWRRCQEKEAEKTELKNMKLYAKNKRIMEENEELRKKANLLYQEYLGLMSEMKKKFPSLGSDCMPTSSFPLLCKQWRKKILL